MNVILEFAYPHEEVQFRRAIAANQMIRTLEEVDRRLNAALAHGACDWTAVAQSCREAIRPVLDETD